MSKRELRNITFTSYHTSFGQEFRPETVRRDYVQPGIGGFEIELMIGLGDRKYEGIG